MTSKDELTSTERLLDVIRSDGRRGSASETAASMNVEKMRRRGALRKSSKEGQVSIGVEIDDREVRLVKVDHFGDRRWRLRDYRRVKIKSRESSDINGIAQALKDELAKMGGTRSSADVWAVITSEDIKLQNIHVPKVGKNLIDNAVYWSAKRNMSFDEATVVFDYEVRGDVIADGAEKLDVQVYTAPRRSVDEIRNVFEKIGSPLAGITLASFAIQNIMARGWMSIDRRTVSTLYIGGGWSRIDIFSDGKLAMTRDIKAGLNSIAESLVVGFNERRQPTARRDVTETGMENLVVDVSMTHDNAMTMVENIGDEAIYFEEQYKRYGLRQEEVFDLIGPALERMVRQVERTFEYYATTLKNERVEMIYVASPIALYRPVLDYFGDQLVIEKDRFDPLDSRNPAVEGLTEGTPQSDRIALGHALGAALSSAAETPNMLMTKKEKTEKKSAGAINRVIRIACGVLIFCVAGYYFWLGAVLTEKKTVLADIKRGMDARDTVSIQDLRSKLKEIATYENNMSKVAARHVGVAAIGEIAALTPADIQLTGLTVTTGRPHEEEEVISSTVMSVNGIVSGDEQSLETKLAQYLVTFENSVMCKTVRVTKKARERIENSDVLRFTIVMDFV